MTLVLALIPLCAIAAIIYFLNHISRKEEARRANLPERERKRLEDDDDSWMQVI